jgi:hypothetical protein
MIPANWQKPIDYLVAIALQRADLSGAASFVTFVTAAFNGNPEAYNRVMYVSTQAAIAATTSDLDPDERAVASAIVWLANNLSARIENGEHAAHIAKIEQKKEAPMKPKTAERKDRTKFPGRLKHA